MNKDREGARHAGKDGMGEGPDPVGSLGHSW
jgi:hypothetical protein